MREFHYPVEYGIESLPILLHKIYINCHQLPIKYMINGLIYSDKYYQGTIQESGVKSQNKLKGHLSHLVVGQNPCLWLLAYYLLFFPLLPT